MNRVLYEQRPARLKVLTGSEVGIRADGSLDYTEETLGELDVVVASVHSAMCQERDEMRQRIIRAMQNPYVTVQSRIRTGT